MPAQRRRNLLRQRKRIEDDGDDDTSVVNEAVDDSQSDASLPSDPDDDADADDSDLSDTEGPETIEDKHQRIKSNGTVKREAKEPKHLPDSTAAKQDSSDQQSFPAVKDTDMMMNGVQVVQGSAPSEAIDFKSSEQQPSPTQTSNDDSKNITPAERRRREHEEYKKKRDENPAFIPNRGAFFMHDQRNSGQGFRGFGRGRGRGRIEAPQSQPDVSRNGAWSHDLHDTLLEPQAKPVAHQPTPTGPSNPGNYPHSNQRNNVSPPARSFSTTKLVGKVQLRVSLPGMQKPIIFSEVPVNHYTKLPNHRPPLRRDKPVRMSLPDHPVRYIFPSTERSFIFIPRALRPNQQGFGRGRGKAFGSMGGFSSRRTSIYGGHGSLYSPSVAMSRRSSIARDFNRDGMASPAGSTMSGRPVVRLPPGAHPHSASGTPTHPGMSGSGTPVMSAHYTHGYPPPQNPTYRENWPKNIQMHQPRPQKTISVTGIEAPANNFPNQQQGDQQPFHHQVPQHVNGNPDPSSFPPTHTRQPSYPNQQSAGTPLSNIPERAIHAQPFQPYQQPGYQPPVFNGQPNFYYPPGNGAPAQYPAGAVIAPVYVQNPQQGGYLIPTVVSGAPQPVQSAAAPPAPNGMVAHEQNGMVYYLDPTQLYPPQEGYQQPNYTMPGMGGMMTPTPDGYYYPQAPQGPMYYPSQ